MTPRCKENALQITVGQGCLVNSWIIETELSTAE